MNRYLLLAGLVLTGCGNPAPQPPQASAPTGTPTPVVTELSAEAIQGQKVFEGTCAACHGSEGQGIMNLGKPLVGSPMLNLSDSELVAFIVKGRDSFDKDNTTGSPMPPRGGNPALTDTDLLHVVAYLRSLQ